MGADEERAFHLERAEQCRMMAAEADDPAIRRLHEQLAEFHEAEARRAAVSDRGSASAEPGRAELA